MESGFTLSNGRFGVAEPVSKLSVYTISTEAYFAQWKATAGSATSAQSNAMIVEVNPSSNNLNHHLLGNNTCVSCDFPHT